LDVFSKYIKLYPLRSATAKASLKKLLEAFVPTIVKPETVLSDNGTQFTSRTWVLGLEGAGIGIRYSPIRNPQSNPVERYMREIGKACRIYCHQNHRKWPELVPKIEEWLNDTVSDATGFAPCELMYGVERPKLFTGLMTHGFEEEDSQFSRQEKEALVFDRIKRRAEKRHQKKRNGRRKWDPGIGEMVLVEAGNQSDALKGITLKFQRPYDGPYRISRVVTPSIFELVDARGNPRGRYNKRALKKFLGGCGSV
jgi:hypothetical protein